MAKPFPFRNLPHDVLVRILQALPRSCHLNFVVAFPWARESVLSLKHSALRKVHAVFPETAAEPDGLLYRMFPHMDGGFAETARFAGEDLRSLSIVQCEYGRIPILTVAKDHCPRLEHLSVNFARHPEGLRSFDSLLSAWTHLRSLEMGGAVTMIMENLKEIPDLLESITLHSSKANSLLALPTMLNNLSASHQRRICLRIVDTGPRFEENQGSEVIQRSAFFQDARENGTDSFHCLSELSWFSREPMHEDVSNFVDALIGERRNGRSLLPDHTAFSAEFSDVMVHVPAVENSMAVVAKYPKPLLEELLDQTSSESFQIDSVENVIGIRILRNKNYGTTNSKATESHMDVFHAIIQENCPLLSKLSIEACLSHPDTAGLVHHFDQSLQTFTRILQDCRTITEVTLPADIVNQMKNGAIQTLFSSCGRIEELHLIFPARHYRTEENFLKTWLSNLPIFLKFIASRFTQLSKISVCRDGMGFLSYDGVTAEVYRHVVEGCDVFEHELSATDISELRELVIYFMTENNPGVEPYRRRYSGSESQLPP